MKENNKEELKAMPNATEAEQALLGCALSGGEREIEICLAWIRDNNAFYDDKNKNIWKAIQELYRNNVEVDLITLSDKMKDMTGDAQAFYITGLTEQVPTVANITEYARIVWEKYIQRETAKSARKLMDASYEDYKEVGNILEKHTRLISELREIQPSKQKNISDLVDQMKHNIKDGTNIIPFNKPYLDFSAGGMTRKEITVIGGRPGHGKTTLVTNIIKGLIEQGYKVMMFNREMSNTEMLKKFVVMESPNLLYANIRQNSVGETNEVEFEDTVDKIKDKYQNLIMYENIRNLDDAMREIAKHKPDVIVDDYIQLIQVNEVKEGRRFEIERIMQEYKWICKSENCSAILVSQLNREIEKRIDPRPRMSDYAESGVIEQTAESAVFVFYGYNFDHERFNRYGSEIIISKSRYGRVGTYPVGFNGNRCSFYMNKDMAVGDEPQSND
jgi:replicative DNA helicase|tara:strand:- start:2504 stop:3838 length:1335 start_codon:yes stop_codon:yes gene_type:complete